MKYLIEIHHGIGDVVQMTGVIDGILDKDKSAQIYLILNKEAYKSLFSADDRVKGFYIIDMKDKDRYRLLSTIWDIRKQKFDIFMLSPISNENAAQVLAALVGAKSCYGEQLTKISKLSKKYHLINKPLQEIHIVERNCKLAKISGILEGTYFPRLVFNNGISVHGKRTKRKIGLVIGTSIDVKEWNIDNYICLSKELEQKNYEVAFIGGKREAFKYEKRINTTDNISALLGKTSLMESLNELSTCDLVIGGDTGLMHMCAAIGVKTLCLFGPTNGKLHAPYSDKSYVISADIDCVENCELNGTYLECKKCECMPSIDYAIVERTTLQLINGINVEKYKFQIGE